MHHVSYNQSIFFLQKKGDKTGKLRSEESFSVHELDGLFPFEKLTHTEPDK